jgi:phosphate:Na+ symporter
MEVGWLHVGMGLFGGLAIFLGGLDRLSEGLKQAAGAVLRTVLARLTTNRVAGALTGALVTAVLNSSSVTTVLVVGFVTAGAMTLSQSVGVIMGANIGSTFTAQVLAFDVSSYALAPVAIGFFMTFVGKRERLRQYGTMILGLGLVFFGMGVMSDAMKPLRAYPPFVDLLASLQRPLFGVLAGALSTAVVQSSAATMGIAIALASEGFLSLGSGITLALGANIGTCATALLAAIGKPTAAVRAAVVHLTFNVLGTVIWLPMLAVLAEVAIGVSPATPELEGVARASVEVPRQLANANTLFNVVNTLLFLPFTGWFARLAERLIKEKPAAVGVRIEPRFLDDAVLAVPSLAVQQVRRETARLGELVQHMLEEFAAAVQDRDLEHITAIARRADEVAALQAAILRYLGLLRQRELSYPESAEVQELMEAVFHFESLGRLVTRNLVDIARQAGRLRASAETAQMLRGLYECALASVVSAVQAIREADVQAAAEVAAMRERVDDQVQNLLERQATRLRPEDPDYLVLARLQMSIVDELGRVYDLAARIARAVLASGASTPPPGDEPPARPAAI